MRKNRRPLDLGRSWALAEHALDEARQAPGGIFVVRQEQLIGLPESETPPQIERYDQAEGHEEAQKQGDEAPGQEHGVGVAVRIGLEAQDGPGDH